MVSELADNVCGSFLARSLVARAAVGDSPGRKENRKTWDFVLFALRILAVAELEATVGLPWTFRDDSKSRRFPFDLGRYHRVVGDSF